MLLAIKQQRNKGRRKTTFFLFWQTSAGSDRMRCHPSRRRRRQSRQIIKESTNRGRPLSVLLEFLVEYSGLEPLTSTLPVLRSTRWANTPYYFCKFKKWKWISNTYWAIFLRFSWILLRNMMLNEVFFKHRLEFIGLDAPFRADENVGWRLRNESLNGDLWRQPLHHFGTQRQIFI